MVPDRFGFFTVTHELGHTFGLYHDFRDNRYIMSYGGQPWVLSACAAEFLAVHAYFNPAVPISEGQPPTVEITSPTRYQPGTTSVSVQLQVSDSEGVHQVSLIGNAKPCRGLAGEGDAVVEFDYDGNFWAGGFTNLSDQPRHHMLIVAVDGKGNVSETNSFLTESSPYEIAILRGDADHVGSVAFSPVESILAAGPWGSGSFILWDVSTRERIGTLESAGGDAIAFSPEGDLLASPRGFAIQLWDVRNRELIDTFEGHTGSVRSVAFSTDGALLASGSEDRTVRLWDVGSRTEIATLEGHAAMINAVAFSPDGTLLASGSGDAWKTDEATVRLWDVESRAEITIPERTRGAVEQVAFSPDGKWLIWPSWPDANVTLWDVESREPTATFEGSSFALSPDGAILACFSGTITLWEVGTGSQIVTLPDAFHSTKLSFSPDGAILAAGSWSDGTITLWDVSEWTSPRPRPSEVAIISGDNQRAAPGAILVQPLVVEVRDQYGNPLPNAAVTFTVTAGEGKLSDRFTVEHATTDADGRVALTLTLGPALGRNIVGVSLGGHELATFTAEGMGTAVPELEGDYRSWHLPPAATARLGKGAMGQGDRSVALSADGRFLAVASAIGVWLYEAATSRALAMLPTETPVHSLAFSLDGTLASGLDNGRVELWGVESGERIGTLRHADWGRVTAVVFSPDGTRLASGSWDQVIKVWDVETRREVGTWEVPPESDFLWPLSVAFSPDGTRLVSGFQDGTVRLWDVATQTEVAVLEGHTDRVTSVSFSPDGATLASSGGWDDPTVRLWDVATQAQVAMLRGHRSKSDVRSVSFSSPDGATLASGSSDRTVRLWDVATHEEVATFEEHRGGIRSVTFSRDGSTLVSGAADGTVLLRELETGNVAGLSGHGSLSSLAFSPDGTLLASGYLDGTIRLWDAATRTRIATLEGPTFKVYSVSFSPDGGTLASGSSDRTVKLWDVATRELVGTLEGHMGSVYSVSFSPDGATLASAGGWNDATVRLWDVGARELIGSLEGHTKEVLSVAFSPPGGAFLASAGGDEDKTVKLWDVANQQLIATLEGHENGVYTVAFSPDGNILASVSWDGTRLWSVTTREPIGNLEGALGRSAAFSPDGKSLVSGSSGTVSLWDMMTKRRTANLQGHTGWVHSVAFTRDGATLASGASDGTMLLWNLGPHPRTLTKVPGRRQQGPAGTVLDQPFVVLVLDQYGDPLAGATVTFRVTAGGGTLSVTTATTDAEGRAATTLTLGSQPGTNTVVASVKDVEPATFTATAKSDPDFDGDGDRRIFRLCAVRGKVRFESGR